MVVRITLPLVLALVCTVCCRPQGQNSNGFEENDALQPKLDLNNLEENPHFKKLFQQYLAEYIEKQQHLQTTTTTTTAKTPVEISSFPSKTPQPHFFRATQPKPSKRIRQQHTHESTTEPIFTYVQTSHQTSPTSQPYLQTNPQPQRRIFIGTIDNRNASPDTQKPQQRRRLKPTQQPTTSPVSEVTEVRNQQQNQFVDQKPDPPIAPVHNVLSGTQTDSDVQRPHDSGFDEEVLRKYAAEAVAISNPLVASEITVKHPLKTEQENIRKHALQFEENELRKYAAEAAKSVAVSNPFVASETLVKKPSRTEQDGNRKPASKTVSVPQSQKTVKKSSTYDEDEFRRQAESAKYEFASSVDDSFNGNQQIKEEVRDGLAVKGKYSFSDGYYKRTVHYEADDKGYRVIKQEVEPLEGPQIDLNGHAKVSTYIDGNNVVNYQISKDDIQARIKTVSDDAPSFEPDEFES